MSLRPLFTSIRSDWKTPCALYQQLDEEFSFTLDPCPPQYKEDGLQRSWKGHRVFCNPPYGPAIALWLAKAQEADVAVYLLPARTDTRWWHDIVLPRATEIRFLRGRLHFDDTKGTAPFPSCVVIFHKSLE